MPTEAICALSPPAAMATAAVSPARRRSRISWASQSGGGRIRPSTPLRISLSRAAAPRSVSAARSTISWPPVRLEFVERADQQLAEVSGGGVVVDQSNSERRGACEAARCGIWRIVQLADGRIDQVAGLRLDVVLAVDDAGHRHGGNACASRHVADIGGSSDFAAVASYHRSGAGRMGYRCSPGTGGPSTGAGRILRGGASVREQEWGAGGGVRVSEGLVSWVTALPTRR